MMNNLVVALTPSMRQINSAGPKKKKKIKNYQIKKCEGIKTDNIFYI